MPLSPRTTSQLPLDETTVPVSVWAWLVPVALVPVVVPVLWEVVPCCGVPVVEPVWAANSPATPRLRAAPKRNALRMFI